MTATVRFGLIGCGMIARLHAGAIREIPGAELGGAFDPVPGRAEAFMNEQGGKPYPSVEALLADPAIDAVCICTPSGTHAELAVQAAEAGKHVVVEKPMAITLEQLWKVKETCRKTGVKFCCISQLRFTRDYRLIREAVAEGRLGRLVCGDIYMKYYRDEAYYAGSSWRGTLAMDGGGALMNQGIHGVDLVQSIMGPVKSVFARSRTLLHKIEAEDTLSAVLEYESGALGVIEATTSTRPGYSRRMEINGTLGGITLTEDRITAWDLDASPDLLVNPVESGVRTAGDPTALAAECHREQLADMVAAIRSDRLPLIDAEEGSRAVEIILAIYRSAKTGKPVELSELRQGF